MQIDCRNLDCPKPVIKTRDAITELKIGDELEILLNTKASIANVQKFLKSNEFTYEINQDENGAKIKLIKRTELKDTDTSVYSCDVPEARKKAIFLKDNKIGEDPLGSKLIQSFLGSLNSMPMNERPSAIICVNHGVLLTTERANPCYGILKDLSASGVRVISCGTCLDALKLTDKLGVGEVGNAYEIMQILLNYDAVSL